MVGEGRVVCVCSCFDDARGPGDGGANLSVAKTPVGNVPAVVAGTPIPSGIDNAHVPWACGIRPVFILPVGGPVGLAPVEPPRLCLRAQAGVALGDGESQGATGPNILIAGASGVDSRLWVSCIVRVALADVLTTDHERHATCSLIRKSSPSEALKDRQLAGGGAGGAGAAGGRAGGAGGTLAQQRAAYRGADVKS